MVQQRHSRLQATAARVAAGSDNDDEEGWDDLDVEDTPESSTHGMQIGRVAGAEMGSSTNTATATAAVAAHTATSLITSVNASESHVESKNSNVVEAGAGDGLDDS